MLIKLTIYTEGYYHFLLLLQINVNAQLKFIDLYFHKKYSSNTHTNVEIFSQYSIQMSSMES